MNYNAHQVVYQFCVSYKYSRPVFACIKTKRSSFLVLELPENSTAIILLLSVGSQGKIVNRVLHVHAISYLIP